MATWDKSLWAHFPQSWHATHFSSLLLNASQHTIHGHCSSSSSSHSSTFDFDCIYLLSFLFWLSLVNIHTGTASNSGSGGGFGRFRISFYVPLFLFFSRNLVSNHLLVGRGGQHVGCASTGHRACFFCLWWAQCRRGLSDYIMNCSLNTSAWFVTDGRLDSGIVFVTDGRLDSGVVFVSDGRLDNGRLDSGVVFFSDGWLDKCGGLQGI